MTSQAIVTSGKPQDYTIATLASGATLVRDDANFGRDGSRTIDDLGWVDFHDLSVALIDRTGNAETVARLYRAALNRVPDLKELRFYTAFLDQGSLDLPVIATAFIYGPEYTRAYGAQDSASFVNQMYRNVLHRSIDPKDPGDAGAAQQWTNYVEAKGRVAGLIAFADTQENHRLTLSIAGDKHDAEAARLYKAAFNRAPDAPGLANARAVLAHGATPEQVAQGFADSGEFQRAYGNMSPADFVAQLYRNVLGREADAGGKAQFVGALNAGYSRGFVLAALSESDENRIGTAGATHDGWVLTSGHL